ncbi:MAG: hypothetical protein ACLP2Y_07045 [Limisphaerales bacterium]
MNTPGTDFIPEIMVRASTICLYALCLLLASVRLAVAQNPLADELHTAAQVRGLTPQQAGGHLPVRLKGVVTFSDATLYSHFFQDETAGIYLLDTNLPALSPGQLVEVEGYSSPGEYAPIVVPNSVKVLGEGNLPAAKPVSVAELVSGREDSQFVEVSGIVRSVKFEQETKQYLIDLVAGGERFSGYASQLPVTNTEELVDSTVKVSGVCSTLFNRQRQLFGFRLLMPRATDLVIEKPASGNPFDIPTQSINSLLQFTPQGSFGHRVKLSGTVAYYESGSAVFIQDEMEGVYCQTRQRTPLQPGDRVEVLGFPAKGEYTPVLQDSTYRKVGNGAAPAPATLDLDEILTGTHDCRLIQVSARLLERTQRGREQFLVLEKNGFIFDAYLGQDASGMGFAPLQNGSDVLVTGICLIERGSSWRAGEGWRAKSFRLLLRSLKDVMVQKAPPVWMQWGVLRIVGVLVVIILGALLWILILHRRIAAHRAPKA